MPPKIEPEPDALGDTAESEKKSGGCCGCCNNKVAPSGPVKVSPDFWGDQKSCKDFSFCLLFLAFWFGMVIVLITAATNGNGNGVESLVYGKDHQGTTCGIDNLAKAAEGTTAGWEAVNLRAKPVLYFPLDGQNYDPNQDPSAVTLYGICHDECPATLGEFEYDCGCLDGTGSGCEAPGAELPDRIDATITGANETARATACLAAGGGRTWGYKTKVTDGVIDGKDTTSGKVCLTAMGTKFGTAFPTKGFAEHGVSHDCVCEYGATRTPAAGNCWKVDYPTKEVMYRCIPCADPTQADCTPKKSYQTKCVCANDNTVQHTSDGDVACSNPTGVACSGGYYKYLLTTVETQVQPDNAIGDAVSGGFATVIAYINDLFSCSGLIVVCGAVIAMIISWFWVFLLKMFVKPLVWITILAVLGGLAILTFVGLCKSGQLSSPDELIEAYASVGGSNATAYGIPLAPEAEAWMWSLLWIAGGIAFFINFVLLCLKQKQIRQATTVIQEASNALADMPLLIVFPIVPFIICLLIFTYFMIGAAFIWTAVRVHVLLPCFDTPLTLPFVRFVPQDAISMDDLTEAVVEASSNTTVPVTSDESVVFYMFWYHLLGFLWANQLIQAISMTTVAGAYSYWYFYNTDAEKQGGVKLAFLKSLKRVLRYHIGSMAFGALIVALVQFARAILAYVDKQTQQWQNKSKVLQIAFKVVACCLWCFEKLIKFVTRNAYIFIAINGKAFCTSAKHAFFTIIKNLFLVGFVNLVSMVLILLGKLIIMVGCGVLTYLYIEASGNFTYSEKEAVTCINPADGSDIEGCSKVVLLKSPVVPVVFTMLLAYIVASMFFYTYQMGVDTLLMCFIEEKTILDKAEEAGQQTEFSGPPNLVKYMKSSSKGKKGADADKQKDDTKQPEDDVQVRN